MIERFNFFDLYGYLFPGAAFLLMVWAPFAMVGGLPAPDSLTVQLLVALLTSYLTGLLLGSMGHQLLPSDIHVAGPAQPARKPSDIILDEEDGTFEPEFKQQLRDLINRSFGLTLTGAPNEKQREEAFFLCRASLIHEGKASYVEQYQGMYTLTRGLALGCFFAAFFYFGWSLASAASGGLAGAGAASVLLASAIAICLLGAANLERRDILDKRGMLKSSNDPVRPAARERFRRWLLSHCPVATRKAWWYAAMALVLLGCAASFGRPAHAERLLMLMVGCGAVTYLGLRFRSMQLYFMGVFASSVYRDFVRLRSAGPGTAEKQD